MYVWNSTFPQLLLSDLSPAPFLTIKKLAFGSVENCYHILFASTSDKKFETFKKLGQKKKTKQNKAKTIKRSFFENRRMLFFFRMHSRHNFWSKGKVFRLKFGAAFEVGLSTTRWRRFSALLPGFATPYVRFADDAGAT